MLEQPSYSSKPQHSNNFSISITMRTKLLMPEISVCDEEWWHLKWTNTFFFWGGLWCDELTVNLCICDPDHHPYKSNWNESATDAADDALLHLCVSVSLVVDLVQDDHPIGGRRLLPCDVHRIFRHVVLDGTRNVISLVCGQKTGVGPVNGAENVICSVETGEWGQSRCQVWCVFPSYQCLLWTKNKSHKLSPTSVLNVWIGQL